MGNNDDGIVFIGNHYEESVENIKELKNKSSILFYK